MKKILLLITLCVLSLSLASAQMNCEKVFNEANQDFRQGRLNELVQKLNPCAFDETVSRPLRRDMLNLLVEAYQFLDEKENADTAYLELLRLDPFFGTNQNIPEMQYIHNAYETYPLTSYSIFSGLQFLTRPIVEKQFSPEGVEILSESYERERDDLFGWVLGADASVNLFNSNFDLSLGYTVSTIFFRYRGDLANAVMETMPEVRTNAKVSFLEKNRWSQIPVTLTYHFVANEKMIRSGFIPYVSLGFAPEFLNRRSSQFKEPYIRFQDAANELATNKIDVGTQRSTFNFSVLAGLGFKWHFKRYFSLFDVRYQRMLKNLVNPDQRYANAQLIEGYNYLDNDFQLHSLGFRVGLGFFLFTSRKK